MKVLKTAFLLLLIPFCSIGQKPTVSFDYAKENFNENQPLPAETHFMLTSPIPKEVMAVGIEIYRGKDISKKTPLYTGFWKRQSTNSENVFYLPVNYKLRNGLEYDFKIAYYRKIDEKEKEKLISTLYQLIDTYVDQSFGGGKRLELSKSFKKTVDDLDEIVTNVLSRYKSLSGVAFEGFSDLVKNKISQIEEQKLDKKDSLSYKEQRTRTLGDLSKLIRLETNFIQTSDWVTVNDSKTVMNYPVEKTMNVLTLQVGYGGTYLDGDIDNLSYDSAPQVGLVLPLGNAAFASKFFSKSSVVAGIYLSDFKDENNQTVSGPIIKKPFYTGLGYNIFRFVRLNAGVTFLEENHSSLGGSDSRVFVRPFIGLTADLKLWIDLAK